MFGKYYGPLCPSDYTVLSKGFKPFNTDNLLEAEEDAAFKKDFSSFVSIIDINDEPVIKYRNGKLIYRRP